MILEAVIGSHAYGPATPDSDVDRSLLSIRDGSMAWDDAVMCARRLGDELVAADGPLPEEPDRAAVEDWLVSARRRAL